MDGQEEAAGDGRASLRLSKKVKENPRHRVQICGFDFAGCQELNPYPISKRCYRTLHLFINET